MLVRQTEQHSIAPQRSKTVIIFDQGFAGAEGDEGNNTDEGDMDEMNYTDLMEGKIGIGDCVN